jgi:hypothetical protein
MIMIIMPLMVVRVMVIILDEAPPAINHSHREQDAPPQRRQFALPH